MQTVQGGRQIRVNLPKIDFAVSAVNLAIMMHRSKLLYTLAHPSPNIYTYIPLTERAMLHTYIHKHKLFHHYAIYNLLFEFLSSYLKHSDMILISFISVGSINELHVIY